MPGSLPLNAPSYLPALLGSRMQGTSLLASLSGKSGLTPDSLAPGGLAPVLDDPVPAPEQAATSVTQLAGPTAAEPQVKRDIAQFTRALATANTPAQLLANPVALKVLLTANGLADQAGNSALATRALLSKSTRSNSLLNQLEDTRWIGVNNRYSFATQGLSVLKNPVTIAAIAHSYAEAVRATGRNKTPPDPTNALDPQPRAATPEAG
jgi:Protein of unknown function (DUF1217)